MAKKPKTEKMVQFPNPDKLAEDVKLPERMIPASVVDHIIEELVRHFRQSEAELRVAYQQREDRLLAAFVAAQVKTRELGG